MKRKRPECRRPELLENLGRDAQSRECKAEKKPLDETKGEAEDTLEGKNKKDSKKEGEAKEEPREAGPKMTTRIWDTSGNSASSGAEVGGGV